MIVTDKDQKKKTIGIIAGIVVLLLIIIVVIFGVTSVFKIILFLLEASVFLAVLGAMGYLVYFLFIKKQRFDIVYVNKKKLIEAGKVCNLENLHNLYLSGDKGHTRINLGKIMGYCRIQILSKTFKYKKVKDEETGGIKQEVVMTTNKAGESMPDYNLDYEEQDVFIIKQKGFSGMLGDPMVVRVSPSEHDELIGDVTLRGYSLLPISEFWFLNTDYLDVRKIDYAILKEAERGVFFEGLRDMKEIVDKAVALDSRHKKDIESKHLIELPELQTVQK